MSAQDLALGAGRVVLGQRGDLLEQLAAAGVVEPLRRQRLRARGQAGPGVGAQRGLASGRRRSRWAVDGHRSGLLQRRRSRWSAASDATSGAVGHLSQPGSSSIRFGGDDDAAGLIADGQRVAPRGGEIRSPSVSSRLSREPGAAAATSATTSASAVGRRRHPPAAVGAPAPTAAPSRWARPG